MCLHTGLLAAGWRCLAGGDYDGQRTVPDGMPAAVQVEAGVSNTCATMKDGTLACWGELWRCMFMGLCGQPAEKGAKAAAPISLLPLPGADAGSEANGPVPNGLSGVIHVSLSMRNSCAVSKK